MVELICSPVDSEVGELLESRSSKINVSNIVETQSPKEEPDFSKLLLALSYFSCPCSYRERQT